MALASGSASVFYADEYVTLYNADVRQVLPQILGSFDVLITDPPYPNNAGHFDADVPLARAIVASCDVKEALIFWNELETPPCPLPFVAKHVWHRNNVNGRPYEPIYHFNVDGRKRRSEVMTYWAIKKGIGPADREYLNHPTQKALSVMQWLVAMTEGVVFDPYAGVGATLHAAKNLQRRAIGIERDPTYCAAIAKRLAQDVLCLG